MPDTRLKIEVVIDNPSEDCGGVMDDLAHDIGKLVGSYFDNDFVVSVQLNELTEGDKLMDLDMTDIEEDNE